MNGSAAADCLWCTYVAPRVPINCLRLSLLSVVATAAPIISRRRHAAWLRLFCRAAHQRLSNSLPLYAQKDAMRRLARPRPTPLYIDRFLVITGYDGNWHYFGPARL